MQNAKRKIQKLYCGNPAWRFPGILNLLPLSVVKNRFKWRLKTCSVEVGERTLLMGIVNVTPDSFSNHGEHFDHHRAIEHGLRLLEEGADILDIGGESTRPGTAVANSQAVPEGEELRRSLPVLEGVLQAKRGVIISVDTYKARVARAAVEAGAEIVNDVSGGAWDKAMLAAIGEMKCGFVLAHTRGTPQEWKSLPRDNDIVATVRRELGEAVQRAEAAGIERECLVIDPGFGFGKNLQENYAMLAHLDEFLALGLPLLAGTSRKGFLGKTLTRGGSEQDCPVSERLYGSLASATASILKGANIIRVHDVRAARDAALVADEIAKA